MPFLVTFEATVANRRNAVEVSKWFAYWLVHLLFTLNTLFLSRRSSQCSTESVSAPFGWVVARGCRKRGNRQTDRQTYKPSTVTLAVPHVHQGLAMNQTAHTRISYTYIPISCLSPLVWHLLSLQVYINCTLIITPPPCNTC